MDDKKIDTDIVWAPWMRIMLHGADCLSEPCGAVEDFDEHLIELAHDMGKTMYAAGGIGLAAPQVGHNKRLIAVDCSHTRDDIKYFVNPEIVSFSGYTNSNEGCLSFPGLILQVRRHKQIKIKAHSIHGEEISFDADGILSICIQHEIDHLDGITFTQRVSRQVRRAAMRKWNPLDFLEVHDGGH